MAGTLGGVSATFVRGRPRELKTALDIWVVAGRDGYGVMDIGLRNSEFRFEVVNYDTSADLETWAASMAALQGTIITVVNDFGDSYDKMLVVRVGQAEKSIATHAPGGYRAVMTVVGVRLP